MENYRKFINLELKFPTGAVAIVGRNGSGKSTLMEAVAWAIYGNEAAIVRVNKESVKNVSAKERDPVVVEIGFILEGQNYIVRREMRGSTLTTRAQVTCQGALVVEGPKEVNKYLNALLGLDYQGFFSSVFAKQKELKALSNEDPAERRRLIIRMLGIDAIEKALQEVRSELRGGIVLLNERRKMLKDEKGRSLIELNRKRLEKRTNEREEQMLSLGKMNDELSTKRQELEAAQERLRGSQERRDEYHALSAKKSHVDRLIGFHIDSIKKMKAEIRELEKANKRLVELQEELAPLEESERKLKALEKARSDEENKRNIERRISELEANRRGSAGELKKLTIDADQEGTVRSEVDRSVELLEAKRTEKENNGKEIVLINQKIALLEKKIEKYRKRLGEIAALPETSKCPTCERPLREAHPLLMEKYSRKIEKKKKTKEEESKRLVKLEISAKAKDEDITKIRRRKEELRAELDGFRKKREKQAIIIERLKSINGEMGRIKKEGENDGSGVYDPRRFEELYSKVEELRGKKRKKLQLEGRVSRLPGLEEQRDQKSGERQNLERELSEIFSRLKEIDFSQHVHADLNTNVNHLADERGEIKEAVAKTNEAIRYLSKERERLKNEEARLINYEENVKILEEDTKYLSRLSHLMKEFWNSLISRIRPVLSSIASSYLGQLTDSRYSRIEISENYEIWIYDGNEKYPISRFSGGEEDLANLCLRLAISSIIAASKRKQGLKFIVLDEIFGSQDTDRRRNILEAISHLLNRFEQVFIITHIEQVKEHIGEVVLVEEQDDGSSTARLLTE